MSQTDLVCAKCVGRRTVNNILMKVNSKVMVTTVAPDQPLAYTRLPIFVSESVRKIGKKKSIFPRLRDEVCRATHPQESILDDMIWRRWSA
jgi:hypothetical protein